MPPPRSKTRMFRCLLPMSMMAVSWAVIRGPAAAGRAGGALGGSRAGRSQESHPPLTTADHSACKVLPGSGASHDSSANELAVSRAEEQGRPKHPGAEHDPCNRFTQTGLIQTFSDFYIVCEFELFELAHIGHAPCARSTPAVHRPESARAVPPLAYHAALESASRCRHSLSPHGAAARYRRTVPPHAVAARCRHTL